MQYTASFYPTHLPLRKRLMIIAAVVAAHGMLIAALPVQTPGAVVPPREMEVTMAVPAVAQPEKTLPLQHTAIHVPHPPAAQPAPQPLAAITQQDDTPVVVPAEPAEPAPMAAAVQAAPASVALPAGQDTRPDYKAAYLDNRLDYPMMARRLGIQGRVVLDVEVLADGQCGQATVAQSSGHQMLDNAALESVRNWHFVPARHGTQVVTRWFKVPITFALKNDEA
jgi:periplasmic protein TonB